MKFMKFISTTFFTSYYLHVQLHRLGFGATRTVRENRLSGCSLDKTLEKKECGFFDFRLLGSVLATKWNDSKVSCAATNIDTIGPMFQANRAQAVLRRSTYPTASRCEEL